MTTTRHHAASVACHVCLIVLATSSLFAGEPQTKAADSTRWTTINRADYIDGSVAKDRTPGPRVFATQYRPTQYRPTQYRSTQYRSAQPYRSAETWSSVTTLYRPQSAQTLALTTDIAKELKQPEATPRKAYHPVYRQPKTKPSLGADRFAAR